MKLNCFECKTPMDINPSDINDTFIPPDLCACGYCSQQKEPGDFRIPLISYKDLRKKEKEEISKHRWFMSEKLGYDVGKELSEANWRKNHEDDFLKKWHYR